MKMVCTYKCIMLKNERNNIVKLKNANNQNLKCLLKVMNRNILNVH
jgi:hypothetical protein